MANEDQNKLVANVLLDLARAVRRNTTAGFVAFLSSQSPENKREIANAMAEVGLGSLLLMCQDVLRDKPDPQSAS